MKSSRIWPVTGAGLHPRKTIARPVAPSWRHDPVDDRLDSVDEVLSDPAAFTGRVAAWQTVMNYLEDNWIFGAGFGSFWQIGNSSPVNRVATSEWVLTAAHSHNGYLEIFLATGIVGFCIGLVSQVIIPVFKNFSTQMIKISDYSLFCSRTFYLLFLQMYLNRYSWTATTRNGWSISSYSPSRIESRKTDPHWGSISVYEVFQDVLGF